MSGPLDSRADIRAAARRLIAAATGTAVEVMVQRRDLALLLTAFAVRLRPELVQPPNLHPGQR